MQFWHICRRSAVIGMEQHMVHSEEHEEHIVEEIMRRQDRLLAYILTLVPNRTVARDILQEKGPAGYLRKKT